jgi:hypothetical protein
LILSVAFLVPEPPGVKLRSRVHPAPAAKLEPQLLLLMPKSLAFVPVIGVPDMSKTELLKFVSVAVSGPLVDPKSSLGGVRLISV